MTKFELSPKEVEAYEKFVKGLPKKYRSMPKQMIFSFGNGIGVGVKIKVGDKEKDITDYNTW
jgi:hypothetical protein